MNNESWTSPSVWRAIREIVPEMIAGVPDPTISDGAMSDNDRAMAYYIARAIVRIAPMVTAEIEYTRLVE